MGVKKNLENFPTSETAIEMMKMITGNGFYDESYVAKWLFQVMGMEIEDAKSLLEELRKQIFPETATWGLDYHEQKYGLTSAGLTEKQRRNQLINYRSHRLPVNPARIEQIVKSICQKDVLVTENIAPYTFEIKIFIDTSDSNIYEQEIRNRIGNVKPSHLSYKLVTERRPNSMIYVGGCMQQAEILQLRQVN